MCEIYTLPIGRSIALYRDSRKRPLPMQRPPLTRSTNQHLHATPCHAWDAAPWLQDTIGDTIGFHCLIAQISVTRRPDAPTPILRPHVNGAPSRTSTYDDCVHFERITCRRIAGFTTTQSDWFQFGMRPPQADMTPRAGWFRFRPTLAAPGRVAPGQRSRRTPRDRRRPAATHPAPHPGHHDAGRPVTGRAAENSGSQVAHAPCAPCASKFAADPNALVNNRIR